MHFHFTLLAPLYKVCVIRICPDYSKLVSNISVCYVLHALLNQHSKLKPDTAFPHVELHNIEKG